MASAVEHTESTYAPLPVACCSGHSTGRGGGDVRRWERDVSEEVIVCHATTAVLRVCFTLLCGVAGGHGRRRDFLSTQVSLPAFKRTGGAEFIFFYALAHFP